MQTEELIEVLTANCPPVRPLPHPCWRTIVWFTISLGYVVILLEVLGLRVGGHQRFSDLRFIIEVGAALMTAMMAAAGALCAGCPGRPIWERFAPAPFLLLWLASLGDGCWRDWLAYGAAGLAITNDLMSPLAIIAISIGPGVLISIMISRGAPIAPATTMGLAALAAAALGAAALRLIRGEETSIMALAWQFSSVALLTGVGAAFGRFFLRWPGTDEALARLRSMPR